MNQWFKVRRDTAPIFDALCTALRPKREGGESNAPSAMCLLEDSNFRPRLPMSRCPATLDQGGKVKPVEKTVSRRWQRRRRSGPTHRCDSPDIHRSRRHKEPCH